MYQLSTDNALYPTDIWKKKIINKLKYIGMTRKILGKIKSTYKSN